MSLPVESELNYHVLNDGQPYELRNGSVIPQVTLAYQTFGRLNAARTNAVLVFHALSGTPNLAGNNPKGPDGPENRYWSDECQAGWWDEFVGPGKALDTNRFFVICINYIGGCYGSTGPASLSPETGQPYGASFPQVRAADIVDSQVKLLDALGIEKLHAIVGPSIGGLLCLSLATQYPDRVNIVISIASSLSISALQRLVIFEQVLAIENDPHFNGGDYYAHEPPNRGLALARMISHKTFISLSTLERRARREVGSFGQTLAWYELDSPLESYILHQGMKFVQRFDANTYLRILEVWQKFNPYLGLDLPKNTPEHLLAPCRNQQWLIFSIDSDVCFYPDQQEELAHALRDADVPYMHITGHSGKGHDAFLLEPGLFSPHLQFALGGGIEEHHG